MADYNKLIKSWNISLKGTQEESSNSLREILKGISDIPSAALRSKVTYKVIVLMCQFIDKTKDAHDVHIELFRKLAPFISEEQWEGFLQYFNYLTSLLVNKEMWNEALSLVPLLEIKKTENDKIIWIYFEIYRKQFSLLIYRDKYKGNLNDNYFKKISRILQIAFDISDQLFLAITTEIFDTNNFLRHNIVKHLKESQDFFQDCSAILPKLKNITDFDKFYITQTKILRFILNIEIEQLSSTSISLSFLKSFMAVEKIQTHKFCSYVSNLFYYFIKLYNFTKNNDFNGNLKEIFTKVISLFGTDKKTEVWFMDTLVTFTEIFLILCSELRENMNEENIITAFEILYQLTKTLPNINYSKTFCSNCVNLRRHEILNVAQIAAHLYRKAIEMNIKEKSIGKTMIIIINYTITISEGFDCKNAELLLNNMCLSCLKSINFVEDEYQASHALKLLQILSKMKLRSEHVPPQNIVYLYKKLYLLLKDYKSSVHMYCLYIAHLLAHPNQSKENIKSEILLCSKLYEKAGYDYSLTLCDILEEKVNDFEIPTYDKKLLLRLHLEVALKHFPFESYKQSLVERIITQTDSHIEFAIIVHKMGAVTVPGFLKRVERSISKLETQLKCASINKADIFLGLGLLYKRLFIFKCENLKSVFGDKNISESTLSTMDYDQFKDLGISAETNVIEAALRSVEYISKYYNNKQSSTVDIQSEDIIDCVSYLARHLKFRGYYDYAHKAWELVYEVASETKCPLNKIRAISFFSEQMEMLENMNFSIDINDIIESSAAEIIKYFQEIGSLTPRQQNYVLICILNIARYYASEGDFESVYFLTRGVQEKLQDMENRKDQFELVAATLHAVNFVISIKYERNNSVSPYAYARYIMEEIKSIKYITSEDTVNIPTLMFEAIFEITQFLINRLYASAMKPYLYMLLKFATNFGLTFRITQTLFFLGHIDLQMELAMNSMVKLDIMDMILLESEYNSQTKRRPISPIPCMSAAPSLPLFSSQNMLVEPMRKALPSIILSPTNLTLSADNSKNQLSRYLISHDDCTCKICKNPIFLMVSFQIGVLRARCAFINQDFTTAKKFFEEAFLWWKKLDSAYLKFLFRDISYWMLMYLLNALRRTKDYDRALEVCGISLKYHKQYESILDFAHYENAMEQKISVEYIKGRLTKSSNILVKELKSTRKAKQNKGNKEYSSSNSPILVQNNNEGEKIIKGDELRPPSPENRIKKRVRKRLQICENSPSPGNFQDLSDNVQPQSSMFDKKENNQIEKNIGKDRERKPERVVDTKKNEPEDITVRITRSRRRRI